MSRAKKQVRARVDSELRREQILEQAARIVSQRGYYGFGIQELARDCGLTNGGLLYYFGSKEGLLIALLENRDRRDAEAIREVVGLTRQSDTQKVLSLEEVHRILRATVKRNSGEPELVRLYTVLRAEALNRGHPARDYFLHREAGAQEAFTQMVAPYVKHPRSTARQLLAFMNGLEEEWLRTDQGFDLLTEWERGVALLLART
jgi:AcrR family transcriptional regulator